VGPSELYATSSARTMVHRASHRRSWTRADEWQSNGARIFPRQLRHLPTPFLETRDRAALFYKDWGAGKPVVFVHSWALNSDM